MASNALTASGGPLSMMAKISPIAYLYRPEPKAGAKTPALWTPPAPKLIVVCTWLGAQEKHIAKYILRYQAVYPTSQILLIRCEFAHLLNPDIAVREIQPAVSALREAVGENTAAASSFKKPEMLVHVFSNGGSSMLCHLYDACKPASLPRHVKIFDSAPGQWSYRSCLMAISVGVSGKWKFLLTPFFHIVVIGYYVKHFVFTWNRACGDPLARCAAAHNDPAVNATEVKRAYIYGDEDQLVASGAVEEHGADAKRKGFEVRMEKFVGGGHVAHARTDVDRYWRIVDDTWRGRF
ncbi:hypothetical protein MAPG_10955 [Magnaporthiopsis poae ATCC 64411]|uniref:Indole-diterpene biosynthesis protein PaxU n=1 Tax=Magnaporthiopsis poae (strain ATCC 64411 / 73-15) TaxID=644358 RepID=A0A0C4EDZ5_MAGP6|nr:hypothetical protein MAPG_10955 [Magnaporthiopsis poae ATCC 64411]